jgi:hypothetical protein
LQVLGRGVQAVARGAAHVLDRGIQAVARGASGIARGAARCASKVLDRVAQAKAHGAAQVQYLAVVLTPLPAAPLAVRHRWKLDRGAKAVARGAARCVSQVFDRGAKAVARGAATLTQQEINNSMDAQRNRVNITGSICKVAL